MLYARTPQRRERANPPSTGGVAMPDERVDQMLAFIEANRYDAQLRALGTLCSPDERAQALGAYHKCLEIRARFLELFQTPFTAPIVDEPKGEVSE